MSAVLPQVDDLNRPFWDGCAAGELRLQRCAGCGRLRYPISTVCPACLSTESAWEAVSGRGTVYSFAVFRHAYGNAWAERVPYDVALGQLEEGPFLLSNVVGVPVAELRVGLPVTVVFEDEEGVAIPRFRPA
jgi:uncharacterized OB-fold protein